MPRTLGEAFVSVRPDMTGFGPAVDRGVTTGTTAAQSKVGAFAKRAGKLMTVGAAVGLAAFTKSAVGLEAEYGKTMNKVQAASKAPQSEMRGLSNLAMKMGADTVFSANEAASAMLALAKSGIRPAAIEAGALQSALALAAADGLSMERAAEVMGNTLNTFSLRARDSAQVSNALAGAANASSASVDSIALGLAQFGTVAADSSQDVQQSTAAIAALAQAGIQGSDAGTSLKTMFQRLQPTTKAAKEAFESYGLSAYQSKNSMQELVEMGIKPASSAMPDVTNAIRAYLIRTGEATEGTAKLEDKTKELLYSTGMMQNAFVKSNGDFKSITQIAGVLEEKLGHLGAAERAAALNTLFGSDARRAASILTKEGAEGLARYVKETSNQAAAEDMAQAGMKGTAGAIERMQGSIETLALAWGQAIQPVTVFGANLVDVVADKATPVVERFGGFLKRTLSGVDVKSGVTEVFSRVRKSLAGIDWGNASNGLAAIGDSVDGIDWSKVTSSFGQGTSDAISVFAVAVGFAADHLDTLAQYMPLVIAAFVAYKAAQAGANIVGIAQLPIVAAQVVANFALARAINASTLSTRGQTVATNVNTVATSRGRIAMLAAAGAAAVSAGASKALAAGTWLVNAAMTANPIGIVVVALVALGAGLVLAYRKSETFRNIVDGAFRAIGDGGKWLGGVIGAMVDGVVRGFRWVVDGARDLRGGVLGAWEAIKDGARLAMLWLVDRMLWFADRMLGLAVKAFGWAPGIGDKLKAAQAKVAEFRAGVNAEMAAIRDETVKVSVNAAISTGPGGFSLRDGVRVFRKDGGPITGPGGPRGDMIPAMLSNGEWVNKASTVKKAGGFGGMAAITRMIDNGEFARRGDVPRYANGGPVFAADAPRGLGRGAAFLQSYVDRQADTLATATGSALLGFAERMLKRMAAKGGGVGSTRGTLNPAQIARGQAFARSQAGDPYVWGGVGPNGYDCSGFLSAVLNAALGLNPYSRRGSTGTMPWPGFSPGNGAFTIGWFTGSPGHMAGSIGGLGIESAGGVGVRLGSSAASVNSFPRTAHFDRGGLARGRGWMTKDVIRPERVLSPRQTDLYDRDVAARERLAAGRGGRVDIRITNWEEGLGTMTRVAGHEYDVRASDHDRFDGATRDR